MKKKNFFEPREIHCGRCDYRGMARRNKVHGVLLLLLVVVLGSQLFADFRLFGGVSLIVTLVFVVPTLWGVGRLVSRDERALLCPGCGNVNYDLIRETKTPTSSK